MKRAIPRIPQTNHFAEQFYQRILPQCFGLVDGVFDRIVPFYWVSYTQNNFCIRVGVHDFPAITKRFWSRNYKNAQNIASREEWIGSCIILVKFGRWVVNSCPVASSLEKVDPLNFPRVFGQSLVPKGDIRV